MVREGFPVKMKKIILVLSLLALWSTVIGIGEYILLNYEKTPGVLANAPSQWPSETSIERHPDFMTLLMFVHPHCPCTRASIGELAILMADYYLMEALLLHGGIRGTMLGAVPLSRLFSKVELKNDNSRYLVAP